MSITKKPEGNRMSTPPIVTKRNHFDPASVYVEKALQFAPDWLKHEKLLPWLTRYTEVVIRGVSSDFATAAERGIEQAAKLLCDPEFYETKSARLKEQRRKFKEDMARQEWERIERRECPTQEQLQEQLANCEQQLKYHRESVTAYEARIEQLKSKVPKNIRMIPRATQ